MTVAAPIILMIALAVLVWIVRRGDGSVLLHRDEPGPVEPGWTEEVEREGRLRYGRAHGFDAELRAEDARTPGSAAGPGAGA